VGECRPLVAFAKCRRFDRLNSEGNRMIDLLKVMLALESHSAQDERPGTNARPGHVVEFSAPSCRITL
jgi:hypothetical protein